MPNGVAMVMTSEVLKGLLLQVSLSYCFRGALVTYGGNRGTMLCYNPQRYPELYNTYDLGFKEACCGVANMPALFYARRPTDDCGAYQPPALSEWRDYSDWSVIGRA